MTAAMTTTANRVLPEETIATTVKTVHVDTSLQIELCKEQKKAIVVKQVLDEYRFRSTSSFAKLEFKCAWLRDLSYLLKQCNEISRVDELLDIIDTKLNADRRSRNRVSRCHQAVIAFLSRVPGSLSYGAALQRVKAHIREAIIGAYDWWDEVNTHTFDSTGCVRAAEKPVIRGNRIDVSVPRCKPDKIRCALLRFFEDKKTYFLKIKEGIRKLENPSSELVETAKIIEHAESNPEYLCDQGQCLKIGDTLIALDGIDMEHFAANNDKEWVPIASFLGKTLLNPVGDAKGKT